MSLPKAVRRSCIVITTPTICSAGLARARTLSTVSRRSSVPSRAKYDDWMGISRWLEATRAFTVRSPRVGGQSMTTYSNSPLTASSRSLRRKCASSSPTSLASSLARLMRAGARNRCGCAVGTMMSFRPQFGSTKASKTFLVMVRGSMKVSELLPCGSRSMSRVGLPRRASAAARLMAVVVLPTPPFWFAIETIIGDGIVSTAAAPAKEILGISGFRRVLRPCWPPNRGFPLHLVFAHVVGIEALQPFLEPLGLAFGRRRLDLLGLLDDVLFREDRRLGAQRERDRVTRPRVDGHGIPPDAQVDDREVGAVLHVRDHHPLDAALEILDDVAQQVVRHRPWRRGVLDLHGDGVGLEHADPDFEDPGGVLVAQDDDGRAGDLVDHQALDGHLDQHGVPLTALGPASVIRARTREPSASAGREAASGQAMFTMVLPSVRPAHSSGRRRLGPSINTSYAFPTISSRIALWMVFCACCSATIRRVFSGSDTSST